MQEKNIKLTENYRILNQMLHQTSEMLNMLVKRQGDNIVLYYPKDMVFMCLARQLDNDKRICGVIWKMFRLGNNRRFWLKGWAVKNTPTGSLTKRMNEHDREKFYELHDMLKKVTAARKDLVNKKRRILATMQAVENFQNQRLRKVEKTLNDFLSL